MPRITVDITDDQAAHLRQLSRQARRNGDADVTMQDVLADLSDAASAAIKQAVWELTERVLNDSANTERTEARQALDALFPDPA